MKYKIIPEAIVQAELEEVFRWIEEQSPQSAVRWYNGCLARIESLAHLPQRCPLAAESELFEYEIRQLLYGRYRILFTIEEDTIHVLHVRHGARQYMKPEEKEWPTKSFKRANQQFVAVK